MGITITTPATVNSALRAGERYSNVLWDARSLTSDLLGNTITNSGVTADTSIYTIGTQSALFNATNDLLTWPNNSNFYPGTQDFFFSVWARWTRYGSGNTCFIGGFGNGNAANTIMVAQLNPSYCGNGISLFVAGNYASYPTYYVASENVFHHVAVSRSGNTFRVFVDGTIRGTWTIAGLNITTPFRIGSGYSTGEHLNGYANAAQMVIGNPVVTSSFTIASPKYKIP